MRNDQDTKKHKGTGRRFSFVILPLPLQGYLILRKTSFALVASLPVLWTSESPAQSKSTARPASGRHPHRTAASKAPMAKLIASRTSKHQGPNDCPHFAALRNSNQADPWSRIPDASEGRRISGPKDACSRRELSRGGAAVATRPTGAGWVDSPFFAIDNRL